MAGTGTSAFRRSLGKAAVRNEHSRTRDYLCFRALLEGPGEQMTDHPQPGDQSESDDMSGSSKIDGDAKDSAAAHRKLAAEEEVATKLGDFA